MYHLGENAGLRDGKLAHRFSFVCRDARSVHVAGNFNNWLQSEQPGVICEDYDFALKASHDKPGEWNLTVRLLPGVYEFQFVVDRSDWRLAQGLYSISQSGNSVLLLGVAATERSDLFTDIVFECSFDHIPSDVENVHIAGEFNQWLMPEQERIQPDPAWQMSKNFQDQRWSLIVPGGKKLVGQNYKLVCDGGKLWLPQAENLVCQINTFQDSSTLCMVRRVSSGLPGLFHGNSRLASVDCASTDSSAATTVTSLSNK